MLGAQLNSRTISGARALTDESICFSPSSTSLCYLSRKQVSIRLSNSWKRHCIGSGRGRLKSFVVTLCMSPFGRFSSEGEDDAGYVEATVLMSETISHYRMLKHGLGEVTGWHSSVQLGTVSVQPRDPRMQVNSLGPGFFGRFRSPTIFLKISCDGDFILPIIVGKYAVENFINSFHEDNRVECPNHFKLTRNLTEQLGYEVKAVQITKRVVNTYFARILLHKTGEMKTFSVDARPSDAINIAKRCKAPIFVNKQIVLADATMIYYGMHRARKKSIYDVTLDSAADGPDLLSEELNLVRNMNLAAQEERYSDAAMWRDKLMKLRESK